MSERCPTVKIKARPEFGGFLILNEADFDPTRHELWTEESEPGPVIEQPAAAPASKAEIPARVPPRKGAAK